MLVDFFWMCNFFDEVVIFEGGVIGWLCEVVDFVVVFDFDVEYCVLVDVVGWFFVVFLVILGNLDWYLMDELVLVYGVVGEVVGVLYGFCGLYCVWFEYVVVMLGDCLVIVICEFW